LEEYLNLFDKFRIYLLFNQNVICFFHLLEKN